MKSMQGLLHKTSFHAAQQAESTPQNPIAGQKRSWSNGNENLDGPQPALQPEIRFQRSISLPNGPSRLTASKITYLQGARQVTEYTQRRLISATPTSTRDPELDLSHPGYGLPRQIVTNFAALGISSMYPWQKSCLRGPGLLQGEKNLVYCAPTGGGKSLVADLLMLKRINREPGAKAIIVLPYVALVQEKVSWLRRVVDNVRFADDDKYKEHLPNPWRRRADQDCIRVVGFFGGGRVRATWDDFDIGVCTLEKANSLVNTAIDDGSIMKLNAVVLDELHMIDDGHRGYLLEVLATKLLCLGQSIQIVGMSATLPNMDLLANWLDAHSFETGYRPIPIEEHLVYEGKIFLAGPGEQGEKASQLSSQDVTTEKAAAVRRIQASAHKEFTEPLLNAVVALAAESAAEGYGVLVFAGSRSSCESDARWISRVMPEPHKLKKDILEHRLNLLADLRNLSTGVDPVLEETILQGVAFHRKCPAGLTSEERDLIANAYDTGTILVCVATCSLAAGINLPARRVILHNIRMGREYIGPAMLRQMRGRAGRQGKAPVGETYLCCREADLDHVLELLHADIPNVSSCLSTENRRIQRALLEVISVRLATSRGSISDYFGKSLLSRTKTTEFIHGAIEASLTELSATGLIVRDGYDNYVHTRLGKAIVASAIDPDDGVFVHKELNKALKTFVMDGEMHILYVLTPVQEYGQTVNWQVFRNEMEGLDESGLRVLHFLGIKPTAILKLAQGATLKESTSEERNLARVYRRFYVAMQLRDLCNEQPVHIVARKYDMPRGSVQTLSQTCQGFAAGMVKFCEHMGWGVMAAALDHFSDRLMAGARAELLALSKVPFIKSRTARVFFENGYRSIASIANANVRDLLPVLMQAQPNKLRIKSQNDDKLEEKMLAKASVIVSAANRLWTLQMQSEMGEE